MQYLLLIYEEENRFANLGKSEMDKELAEYRAFGKEFASAIQGGNALQPTGTATTVRVREGRRLTTDGPYAGAECRRAPLSRAAPGPADDVQLSCLRRRQPFSCPRRYPAADFPQVSRRGTMRLNTGAPSLESLGSAK
jgi:hypothetical protein